MSNHLTIYRGDSVSFDIKLELEGQSINLNNYLAFFTIKKRKTDPDERAVVRKNSDTAPGLHCGGITVVDPSNGLIRVVLLHDDTKSLLEGSHYYGVNCINRNDEALVYTLLEGSFVVNLDIGTRTIGDPTN
tara:strand:+ start:48241 stop:48636 length:396 start_codon:yes stop_codon:yes gene_type:complete